MWLPEAPHGLSISTRHAMADLNRLAASDERVSYARESRAATQTLTAHGSLSTNEPARLIRDRAQCSMLPNPRLPSGAQSHSTMPPAAFDRAGRNRQSSEVLCSIPTRSGLHRMSRKSAGTRAFSSPPPGGKIRTLPDRARDRRCF